MIGTAAAGRFERDARGGFAPAGPPDPRPAAGSAPRFGARRQHPCRAPCAPPKVGAWASELVGTRAHQRRRGPLRRRGGSGRVRGRRDLVFSRGPCRPIRALAAASSPMSSRTSRSSNGRRPRSSARPPPGTRARSGAASGAERYDNLPWPQRSSARRHPGLRRTSMVLAESPHSEAYLGRLNLERRRRVMAGHVSLIERRRPFGGLPTRAVGDRAGDRRPRRGRAPGLAPAAVQWQGAAPERQFAAMLADQAVVTVASESSLPGGPGVATMPQSAERRGPGSCRGHRRRGAVHHAVGAWSRRQDQPALHELPASADRDGGALGETSLMTRTTIGGYGLLPMIDLNAVFGTSAPVFDVQGRLFPGLYSAKASAQATQSGRVGYSMSKGGPDVAYSDPAARRCSIRPRRRSSPARRPPTRRRSRSSRRGSPSIRRTSRRRRAASATACVPTRRPFVARSTASSPDGPFSSSRTGPSCRRWRRSTRKLRPSPSSAVRIRP